MKLKLWRPLNSFHIGWQTCFGKKESWLELVHNQEVILQLVGSLGLFELGVGSVTNINIENYQTLGRYLFHIGSRSGKNP